MNAYFKHIFADKIGLWSFIISTTCTVVLLLLLLFVYRFLPPIIPVYNRMAWGYQRLGPTFAIFFPLLLSIAFGIVNFYIAGKLEGKLPLLSRFLFLATACLFIFVSIFTVKLLLVII